ncbi:MAG: EAL domain-containing protein [Gammaproteobacteria bacterium]|nr:EAL domain-containing protein [Gammaproteobacteria bacterium]
MNDQPDRLSFAWQSFYLLVDIVLICSLIVLTGRLGLYLTPLFLLLVILHTENIRNSLLPIAAFAIFGLIISLELNSGTADNEILKITIVFALAASLAVYYALIKNGEDSCIDPLTSLPNRSLFINNLESTIKKCNKQNKLAAILFMDLDGFKQVNDTLGHDVGDALLIDVADRITSQINTADSLYRLGGDEFAIILPDLANQVAPSQAAEGIAQILEQPFQINEKLINVGISIGIAIYPTHADNLNDLVRYSDIAMYSAKRLRSGYEIFSEDHNQSQIEGLKLMADLRTAIKQDALHLVFQPQLDLKSKKVNSIEALVRWDHPEAGPIQPSDFIALAEDSVLINELTEWVINNALKQCAYMEEQGHTLNVSINISARNLQNQKIMVQTLSAIERNRLTPRRITLEITETALMTKSAVAIKNLVGLSMMGVHLSIDDFGTGHGSLIYMQKLPIKEIKIDRMFANSIPNNHRDEKIVRSIIHLAHDIDCQVVAEGVETQETMDMLGNMGCDYIQGYLICKPINADELIEWLNNYES